MPTTIPRTTDRISAEKQHALFARHALLCAERRIEREEPYTEKHMRASFALAAVEDLLTEIDR